MGFVLTAKDENSHYPEAGAPESWQESWAGAWYDPITRLGGAQHIGVQRLRGVADATSFITYKGEIIQRYQKYDLPVPPGDYSDIVIGPLSVKTIEPFKLHRLTIDDGGDCSAAFECRSNLEPTAFSYADIAKGHWEVYSRATGVVRWKGEEIAISAHCFLDRSWGPRDWKGLAANRYFWAMFGDDLVFKLIRLRMGDGAVVHNGIAVRNGEQIAVTHVRSETVMDDDGVYPLGAKVWFSLADGTSHEMVARCDGGDLAPQRDNHKSAWMNATFEYGGRTGAGFMAAQELDRYPPWDKQLLAMIETLPQY